MRNLLGLVILGLVAGCSSCSGGLTTQETSTALTTLNAAICVLNHDTDPPIQIAVECFGNQSFVNQVQSILDAHNAAAIRDQFIVKNDAGVK